MAGNPQPLATDSFSYSWLIDQKPPPSIESLLYSSRPSSLHDDDDDCSSVMHPHRNKLDQDFDFNLNKYPSDDLVPADEIFSDGCIKTVYYYSTPSISSNIPQISSANYNNYYFVRKWAKSSNKMLRKCLEFFVKRLRCSRKSIRVVDFDRKFWEVKSCDNSVLASPDNYSLRIITKDDVYLKNSPMAAASSSPQRSPNYSIYESSIHEAILHCKRSFAQ